MWVCRAYLITTLTDIFTVHFLSHGTTFPQFDVDFIHKAYLLFELMQFLFYCSQVMCLKRNCLKFLVSDCNIETMLMEEQNMKAQVLVA